MALGGVFMYDTDGNIGSSQLVETEQVSGLIFDISGQAEIWTGAPGSTLKDKLQGKVIEINSMADLKELGLVKAVEGKESEAFLFGIPYYHIERYFQIVGEYGRLFIMFADCKSNWDAINQMQTAANGIINQIGIWTEKPLWNKGDGTGGTYTVELVGELNSKAKELSDANTPVSILLTANAATVKTDSGTEKKVDLSKIPTCKLQSRYVSIILGQELSTAVTKMHYANKTTGCPVGCIGAVLGLTALAFVSDSIAWVQRYNLASLIPDIEFGFGDLTESSSNYTSTLKYSAVNKVQLDTLDDKGYMFLCKYPGIEGGVFVSRDQTCADETSDYRTIARNRTIHKSRRSVRKALLPYVHSPLKVDPSTGMLSSAKITEFSNIVSDILKTMQDADEISGYSVNIDKNQNVLKNDSLIIKYSIIPIGVASRIEVYEGLALTNK